ncbi:TetR/AcrR family transcriptional regulator [Pelagerythrobacter marensis]|uniref:TetR/AcrR family transcriptional regulator n=1 Tax=Pelagerythrobacter marensis TaxID=543877 RepID=A0ABZ2D1J9_9SPHN
MSTVSTSQSPYHHGALREALIEAGLRALEAAEGGAISLRELAREVGVSPAAVYRHFPNKSALLAALGEAGLARLGAAQEQACAAAGGDRAGFAATGRAYVRFALANPALFRLIFTHGETGSAQRDKTDPAWDLLKRSTVALAGEGPAAERLALQAWSIVHGLAMLMLDGRLPADETLIDRVIDPETLFPGAASRQNRFH